MKSQGLHGSLSARPLFELGARSPGGLRLPDAKPSRSTLYAPRSCAFFTNAQGGTGLAVSDTGNHRVLIWNDLTESFADADVVLGQPDFESEGPRAGGRSTREGMHLPVGMLVHEGRLILCDSWSHRVLIWDRVPTESGTAPDHVLGQDSLDGGEQNRGGAIGPAGFDCPYGVAVIDGDLCITDTQNRRVLWWDGVPEGDRPADRVVGQADFTTGDENRGVGVGANTFRWPHAVATMDGRTPIIADAGNHRLLTFAPKPDHASSAERLVGQKDFEQAFEMPHRPQGAGALRFPYGLVADQRRVYVADTANNRVLVYDAPLNGHDEAIAVLGQPDFDQSGENRWAEVASDTLCWPYGLALHGALLAIADSGNNRVVVWQID